MKKWANLVAILIVLAVVVWAGSQLSTAVVRVLSLIDGGEEQIQTQFFEDIEDPPTLAPTVWEPSDQDYDAVQGVPEAEEEIEPRSTDYLLDGEEEHRVDKTAEELAAEESEP